MTLARLSADGATFATKNTRIREPRTEKKQDSCKAVSWWSDARRLRLADADETRCRLCVKIWRKRGLYHLLAKRSFWRCLIQNINPPLSFWKSSIQNLGFFDD
ncbi:hypothetical protein DU53_06295 [Kosmotoga sp. DU53]|nr:hypothetical protein DU53_06295 [Kosmotoga sp. DU53]